MKTEELAVELALLQGKVGHLEAGLLELSRDGKLDREAINKARGAAGVVLFLLMAVPSALASLVTWFLTRQP